MNKAQEEWYQRKRKDLYLPYTNWNDDEYLFTILDMEKPKLMGGKMDWDCPDKKARYMAALDVLVDRGMCTREIRYP